MRLVWFLMTNAATFMVASAAVNFLGVSASLSTVAAVCLALGMSGAFLSLLTSKWAMRRSTGAEWIEPGESPGGDWVLSQVKELSILFDVNPPKVAAFPSASMNAFATGPRRDGAMIGVSTGLLHGMNQTEVRAVLAHEMAHIANGDMVTMTLIQGVANSVGLFLSRLLLLAIGRPAARSWFNPFTIIQWALFAIFQSVFAFLSSLFVMGFSRRREYRADQGAAEVVGPHAMAAALTRLRYDQYPTAMPQNVSALCITSPKFRRRLRRWVSSHPPIEKRIAALLQQPTGNQSG